MIRNSLLFFLRRRRGGSDSESFGDSDADSHAVPQLVLGLRAGWALMDMSDCAEEAREEVEEPELDMLEVYMPLMVLVVGMKERENGRFVGTAPLVSLYVQTMWTLLRLTAPGFTIDS